MRPIPLILILILRTTTISVAQEVTKEAEFTFNELDQGHLMVGGNVDFYNTFVHKLYPEYYDAFHNLIEFSIVNTGSSVVKNPFISVNGSEFFLHPSDVDGAFDNDDSFDNHALKIWKRFTEQIIHRYYPFEGYRQGTPIEMLTGFGYGICYNNAAAITRLSRNENDFFYDLVSFKHSIPEYRIGERAAVLDGDLKSFYLDHQNTFLANKVQISKDRYLIKRSHHYGRQYGYDKGVNDYIAHLYLPNNLHADTPPKEFSLNYELVPGGKLTIQYTPGKYFFSEYYFQMDPDEFANGFFSYDWQSADNDVYLMGNALTNLEIDPAKPHKLIKTHPGEEASLYLQLLSGFQTGFFNFFLDLGKSNTAPLSVQISPDSTTWISPTTETISGNRQSFDFDLQRRSFSGKVHIRIQVGEGDCQIRDFGYTAYFQLNRLSLPELKQGSNQSFLLNKRPEDSLHVHLKYRERTAKLSHGVVEAVHPKDNELIAEKIDEITWTNPFSDAEVVNYEFLLTRDTIEGLPHAPNFQMYTIAPPYPYLSLVPSSVGRAGKSSRYTLNPSAYVRNLSINQSVARSKQSQEKNKFIIHEEGFFNSGETYYWKVRPLHANGVWGPWSRYFSFSVKKIMPPTNLTVQRDTLFWERNPEGTTPVYFQIHGSNEYLGFEPTADNLIAETTAHKMRISQLKYTFFRVTAIDSSGARSEISAYATRPYPFLNNRPDPVKPDSLFQYKVEFTKAYYNWVSEGDSLINYTDQIGFTILSMPGWLKYDRTTGTLEGKTTAEMLKEEYEQGKNSVDFVFESEIFQEPRHFRMKLQYLYEHHEPDLRPIDTILYANNYFSISTPYKKYSDSITFVLKNKPDWLNFHWSSDSISFYGEPNMSGDFTMALTAVNEYGNSAEVELQFRILPSEIYHRVPAPVGNSLTVSLDTILVQQGLLSATINAMRHSVPGFRIVEENNNLTVVGDFCAIEGKKELAIPVELRTTSAQTRLKLELRLTVTDQHPDRAIQVFHPKASNVVIVQNNRCSFVKFKYQVLNSTGRLIRTGKVSLPQGQKFQLQVGQLPAGLYVVLIRDEITEKSVKFIKQ